MFLLALAATQWKTGHAHEPTIREALQAIEAGQGLERWEAPGLSRRRAALAKLAEQLRSEPRAPVKIRPRVLHQSPLDVGDVVRVTHDGGQFFAVAVEMHEDRGGRAPVVKILPFKGPDLPAIEQVREQGEHDEKHALPRRYYMVFNDKRSSDPLPEHVELVASGVLRNPPKYVGGVLTSWADLADTARPLLDELDLSDALMRAPSA